MAGDPAIAPPPASDSDVTPSLGPVSTGSGSKMDLFRGIINHLSGGGTPAIQERLAADYALRQQNAQNSLNQARQATQYKTHATNSVSTAAPFGINPVTGQPATAQDHQKWDNDIAQGTQGYLKALPKDAKPIAQKLFEVAHHVSGHKPPEGGAAAALPTAIQPPPQTSPTATAGPALPPPPSASASQNPMEIPSIANPAVMAAPENQRMMGVQNQLSAANQAHQQELAANTANIGPETAAKTTADVAQLHTIMQLPPEERFPAMMRMGIFPPTLMRPVEKVVPNDPNDPSKGNHYESHIPLIDLMGGANPAAPLSSGWAGTQTSGSSKYNADTGVTTTNKNTRKVLGGGRPTAIPSPPSGGGVSKPSGTTSPGGGGRLESMSNGWENGTPPSKKDQSQVQQWRTDHGLPASPEVLSGPAQNVMVNTAPVVDQVNKLLGVIDRLKLGDNKTRGYLLLPRLNYAAGGASEEGTLGHELAGLSLGSLVEATAALKGSTRAMPALKIAMEHVPNAWVDSPALIKEKLETMRDRLQDVMDEAKNYGRKNLPVSKMGLAGTRPGMPPAPNMGGANTVQQWIRGADGRIVPAPAAAH